MFKPDQEIAADFPDDKALIVGDTTGVGEAFPSLSFSHDPSQPAGLLLLLPGGEAEPILRTLSSETTRLLIPVADLTGSNHPRADFHANHVSVETVTRAFSETQALRSRVRTVEFNTEAGGSDPMLALALSLTRNAAIDAAWAPDRPDLVGYPLLTGLRRPRSTLEQLSQAGFLRKRFFDRLHTCGGCGSSRLAVRETCPKCESPRLREEALLHHYRCGHQGPRSRFEDGRTLVCPKCGRLLRHYGVDYDAPGHLQLCGSCNEHFTEPIVAFKCTDCQVSTSGDDIGQVDWFHYDLTSSGEQAVIQGRLPGLDIRRFLAGLIGFRAPRDLAMMIDFAVRLGQRHGRPFSVIIIHIVLTETAAAGDYHRAETFVEDVIRGAIRETDFIAALDSQFVLFLPETPEALTQAVVERITGRVGEATAASIDIRAEIVAQDDIPALIELLDKR